TVSLCFDCAGNFSLSYLFIRFVCKKKENSSHMLELHVVETHDTYFEVQREKKPMYACFLQECKLLFMNPEERRDHCIKFHKFPHNFRFDNTKSVRKNSPSNELMELSENSGDPSPPSSSTKSPKEAAPQRVTTIQFGHKNSKCFKPEYRRPDALESMIVDMKENLPDA
ncbi:CLUMA_CG005326, isoform B, partial [Clunio marinus]